MSEPTVTTSIDARGVATVTMSRPEKHNAFDDHVIAELDRAFTAIASNPSVRVMVLASAGKSFSAGADLGWMQRMAQYSHEENRSDAAALAEMLRKLNELPQPTIARVQGAAYGGAVGLVSCCETLPVPLLCAPRSRTWHTPQAHAHAHAHAQGQGAPGCGPVRVLDTEKGRWGGKRTAGASTRALTAGYLCCSLAGRPWPFTGTDTTANHGVACTGAN